ncbi:hypothetical protein [Streptomyces sp. 769]|uniref:hypothetical protein n=1 Tax=Streptomyces sp. 769 TaxID=1262452 RepID=UPI00057D1450|nr:hypothetical protein [Streptomyces sp. 769]AJC53213.1 integral membrane protein [Streptomyces sp. 769]
MRRHLTFFVTAARYDLIVHARNRFAMFLVVLYVPAWVTLAHAALPDKPAPIRLNSTGEFLSPPGDQLSQITGALNAVTLIAGFMMFAATFNGGRFDRRLAMAGHPRIHLALAKTTSLAFACAAVSVYATAVTCAAWIPRQPALLATALFCDAMTYGALGVLFGCVLRREVEGMFAMVMTSVIDVALQNPIANTGANSPLVRLLPSYGSMQAAAGAGFTNGAMTSCLAAQALWFAGAALLALLAFHRRTRSAFPRTRRPRTPTRRRPAHGTR